MAVIGGGGGAEAEKRRWVGEDTCRTLIGGDIGLEGIREECSTGSGCCHGLWSWGILLLLSLGFAAYVS